MQALARPCPSDDEFLRVVAATEDERDLEFIVVEWWRWGIADIPS